MAECILTLKVTHSRRTEHKRYRLVIGPKRTPNGSIANFRIRPVAAGRSSSLERLEYKSIAAIRSRCLGGCLRPNLHRYFKESFGSLSNPALVPCRTWNAPTRILKVGIQRQQAFRDFRSLDVETLIA